jgi:predicted  nucleic acid-binding Zn-ribbon protein
MKAHREEILMKEDTRIALLEQSINNINETMLRLDKRFDSIDRRFENIDKKFENIDKKFYSLEQEMKKGFKEVNDKMDIGFSKINDCIWGNFYWTIGGFIGILGILAHSFEWV